MFEKKPKSIEEFRKIVNLEQYKQSDTHYWINKLKELYKSINKSRK